MAFWGSPWGGEFPWGDGPPGPFELQDCETAECRALMQFRGLSTRNMLDLLCIIGGQFGKLRDDLTDIRNAFDLDTAVGDQLEIIGNNLGLPRNGLDDTDYRRFINIQILLILQSTGSGPNIIAIIRTYLGATANPVIFTNAPPYQFSISAIDMTEADWEILIPFLRKALIGGVLGIALAGLVGSSVLGSATAGPAIPGTSVLGSATAGAPIAGTGILGFVITI